MFSRSIGSRIFALVFVFSSGVVWAQDTPPSPATGLDYRLVMRHGPQGEALEIRRSGPIYRHEMLGVSKQAAILYDSENGTATVIDGAEVTRFPVAPHEIGGFDASATMAGLSDEPVEWTRGEAREIAGGACNDYIAKGSRDGVALEGRFCVTADGVLLGYTLGGAGQIGRTYEASTFEIGPQPPELFEWARKIPEAAETGD